MSEELKDEFILKLAGRAGYRYEVNKLAKEKRLLELKLSELISDAYKEYADGERNNRAAFQCAFIYDTKCDKSPFGMHAVSNFHQFNHNCAWCEADISKYDWDQFCDCDPAWHPKT